MPGTIGVDTYLIPVKNDPKDRLDVIVGDDKQVGFYPQVKLQRWDNEVNFSARFFGADNTGIHSVNGDVITWQKGDFSARFYPQVDSAEHPEGGYEFEIILGKKPPVNKVSFSIETKGLEYLYQPALTADEIARGMMRPDNVIGSYAVYYQDPPVNREGGKVYRTGKAFHIYRPEAVDADGRRTWADLLIANGLLTISISQAWLNTARYPVVVDPTFGYTTAGASNSQRALDQHVGQIATAPSDTSTGTSITMRLSRPDAGAKNFKGMINLHSDLTLVTNGAGPATAVSSTSATWETGTFATPPTITPNTDYVLGGVFDGSVNYFYDSSAPANTTHYANSNYATPGTITVTLQYTYYISVYVTYATGGAPPPARLAAVRALLGVGL